MKDTQTPATGITPKGITPEVGKRYVTRGGWVTPPLTLNDDDDAKYYPFKAMDTFYTESGLYFDNNTESEFDLISEYVEPTVTDTFRRDLIARLYCEMIGAACRNNVKEIKYGGLSWDAIRAAGTLIDRMRSAEKMEAQP